MGITGNKILQKGREIRDELLERVGRKYLKYKQQIDGIEHDVKSLIRQSTAVELSNLLDQQKITSLQAILTFIERVATVGVQNNYIIDEMFQEAISQARYCDTIRQQNPHKKCWRYGDNLQECLPPFFGVPTSLKQTILYKGKTTYVGYISPSNEIPQEQPLFVQIIMRMGFIPFIRTNVSPACKLFQTVNNIFGYCKNPWNLSRSCGGSSGGESGAISSGCSPIGFGSDIGGSIRIPSEWCGLVSIKYALRSTTYGNAYFGKFSSGCSIKSELCPIAKSVEDLIVYSQYMLDGQNYKDKLNEKDVYLQQKSFSNNIFKNKPKLKIGYYKSVKSLYKCSKAHERILEQAIKMLQQQGHIMVQIQIPKLQQIFKAFLKTFTSDSSISYLQQFRKQQPVRKQFNLVYKISSVPQMMKKIILKLIQKKQPRLSFLLSTSISNNVQQTIGQTSYTIKALEREVYTYLTDKQLDAWICPGYPLPAIEHGTSKNFSLLLAQTVIWNSIQYPSGGVPISTVRPQETEFEDNFNDLMTKRMKASLKGSQGLPVGLQVNSFPNCDEVVLYLMKQIQSLANFRKHNRCPDMKP